MATLRIIFVNRVYAPAEAATAQLLTDLAEGLAARGWPVHVITAGNGGTQTSLETRAGVTVHRTGPHTANTNFGSRLVNYLCFLQKAKARLAALVKPGDIVVLMTDPPLLAMAVTQAAVCRGGRVVQWIQDIYPEIVAAHVGPWMEIPLAPLKWMRNRAWCSSSCCVALSHDMANVIAARQPAARPCHVIPNWAPRELEAVAAPEAVVVKRKAWGLTNKFVVAYSGNLGRVHEFDTVLDAAASLRSKKEIVFLFVGGGPRFPAVHNGAERRDLINVRFIPAQPRASLSCLLAAADVQLVTLKPGFESLVYPSKLAGALAAGRPILSIGPLSGEIAQLLASEDCGTAVANGDSTGLADSIERLRTDPAFHRRQSQNARTTYTRHFKFVEALSAWERLLQGLADEY